MYQINDFVCWALGHAKRESIPGTAILPLPREQCGADPWHYLFGSHGHKTTRDFIEQRWLNHYMAKMTRAQYDAYTAGWLPTDTATDCQGLLDAWLTHVIGVATDINADLNYRAWCTDKGPISEITRPWVIGEAVFRANAAGRMTHIGWICGFMPDGEPLIVEARGIAYGVVATRLDGRNWTHRGLMTKIFNYTEEEMTYNFDEVTSPVQQSAIYAKMQEVLNACGCTDYENKPLEVDGMWGRRSYAAFQKFKAAYGFAQEPAPVVTVEPVAVFSSDNGAFTLTIQRSDNGGNRV